MYRRDANSSCSGSMLELALLGWLIESAGREPSSAYQHRRSYMKAIALPNPPLEQTCRPASTFSLASLLKRLDAHGMAFIAIQLQDLPDVFRELSEELEILSRTRLVED